MIANQSGRSSAGAAGLATAAADLLHGAPGKTGAASAFAALLGQLYQPPPFAAPVLPDVTPPSVADSAVAGDAALEAQDAANAQSKTDASSGNEQKAAVDSVAPPALVPRAPRAITSAIAGSLKPVSPSIEGEARFADLKPTGSKLTSGKRADADRDTDSAGTPDAQGAATPQGASAAMLAAAMLVASTPAASDAQATDASDTPAPEQSSNATAAVGASGNSAKPTSTDVGGSATASPMVRAMTLLLDALGVTDRKANPSTDAAAQPETDKGSDSAAKAVASNSTPPGVDLNALLVDPKAALSTAAAGSKGKPEVRAEPASGAANRLPGAIVSQTQGNDNANPGQSDARDRHDSHDAHHPLHSEGRSAAPTSDQGLSGWSGTLGGAVRQGIAATESSELGRAGATAHVGRREPAATPVSTSQVTMDLDPAVGILGKIRVAVRGETVHATITTKDADAVAMGARAHELRVALEERGFSDARVTVRSTASDDAPAAVIASSVSDLKPRAADTAAGEQDRDSQQQPRGERRDQAGGDRSDTRRQRNRQEQPQ